MKWTVRCMALLIACACLMLTWNFWHQYTLGVEILIMLNELTGTPYEQDMVLTILGVSRVVSTGLLSIVLPLTIWSISNQYD